MYKRQVYDGHGGDACAQFLKDELHGYVRRSLDAQSDWSNAETTVNAALRDACLTCDAAFLATNPANRAGSTACILLVFGQSIMSCANVGDSRCCLATASGCAQLSEDQTPARADEAQRIRDAGGFVIHKRVMGELAVSRAFGTAPCGNQPVASMAWGVDRIVTQATRNSRGLSMN